ncbi:hypothetical protein FK268_12685 [Tsukamurella sputi]|uniref:Uncharacterized protein n=1 Tax=Tsukamurella sputi TaxID=2591848 RepID=A0A5C5RMX7_9ACTN|nr:hypothetical protein [Tsukamurella sputi]TWS24439.1 hypothetical protein FK268_12685 [Tsukamurella sputi]
MMAGGPYDYEESVAVTVELAEALNEYAMVRDAFRGQDPESVALALYEPARAVAELVLTAAEGDDR